jgi:hypothetical protein
MSLEICEWWKKRWWLSYVYLLFSRHKLTFKSVQASMKWNWSRLSNKYKKILCRVADEFVTHNEKLYFFQESLSNELEWYETVSFFYVGESFVWTFWKWGKLTDKTFSLFLRICHTCLSVFISFSSVSERKPDQHSRVFVEWSGTSHSMHPTKSTKRICGWRHFASNFKLSQCDNNIPT